MRRPCTFRKTDVTRAAKAVLAAGLDVGRVQIDKDGKIVVITGKPDETATTPLDEWRLSRGSR
jgi:hypothetical protein